MTANIARAICVRMIETCKHCGTQFDIANRPRGSLTCSVDCSLARHRAARAEYEAKQAAGLGKRPRKPDFRADLSECTRSKTPAVRATRVRAIKTCAQCGTKFGTASRPRSALTCSTDCSVARRRAVETERLRGRGKDPAYRAAEAERQRRRLQDPAVRAAKNERKRKRRLDPEYRAAQAERDRKRKSSPEYKAAKKETERRRHADKYQNDPEYRRRMVERQRKRYQSDPEFRAAQSEYNRKRRLDPEYRAALAEYSRKRYRDPEYRAALAEYNRKRRAETVARMLAMLNSGELAAYGTEPYFLYRFYDEDDTLLYIGITNDPERRLYQHTRDKPWADDIARTEHAVYANKTEAAAAEAALIKELGPLHNIFHNKVPLTSNENRQNGQH